MADSVSDLRAFYARVLQLQAEGDGEFVCFFDRPPVLAIYSHTGTERMAPGCQDGAGSGRAILEFEVEDVDEEHRRLVGLGVTIVKPPTTQPWGRRSVWFRDPEGNLVNFSALVSR